MSTLQVIENPRRRKRRRYTAKQRAYGFGGNKRRGSRRRNASLSTFTNASPNPRRRAKRHVNWGQVRKHRRRVNPGLLGGLGSFIDLKQAVGVAGGIVVAKVAPNLVARYFPTLPTSGPMGALVKAGSVVGAAFLVDKVLKQHQIARSIAVGGLATVVYDLVKDFAPASWGLAGYDVTTDQIEGSERIFCRANADAVER